MLLWFLVVFLFFSASDTKRDLYLMPLFPPVALFVAHYFLDLESGKLPLGWLHRGFALAFFALLAIIGVAGPPVAWFLRRDVFWIGIPVAMALAAGAATTVVWILKKRPLNVFAATTFTIVATLMCAVIWIFPYVERFKSRRFFSAEVQSVVPASAPLYVYADTMNDFNYYTGREMIAVVDSRAQVEQLLAAKTPSYLLIKAGDLKRLAIIAPERIRITGGVGSTVWSLVALGPSEPVS
jgi:4-amino-4-deoxy-L-arabinose transferase-like glycosyltransferase